MCFLFVFTVSFGLIFFFSEQATEASLSSENWALNMEICDLVNETEDGPKDAMKAIRKRLNQNSNRNFTTIMYTLTVLETCVKNCHKRFLVLVCSKDFIQVFALRILNCLIGLMWLYNI